ncbi:hypothetical protein IGI04_019518 [Brassica rapa subsp. trilocularis]|uniref:Uncharacterized protein n=1 Tax=Brassica rapa subsp. trilocularis TaxID=1813537 RepID=A0ABQ7MG35_BRACM|nr:hypothetical protein IGI04_019518 [Brassica rapa subsp. trilocularis]
MITSTRFLNLYTGDSQERRLTKQSNLNIYPPQYWWQIVKELLRITSMETSKDYKKLQCPHDPEVYLNARKFDPYGIKN